MVAIAKVVFTSREHVIALEARDKGLLGITLRYPYEIRKPEDYFDDIPDVKIPKDMLELATHIVKTKVGHFKLERFEDEYENALKDLIRKKQSGKPIEAPERREPAKVINLMDALRRSVAAEKKPPAGRTAARKAASKQRRAPAKRSAGRRKAG
jgi:DNA end-binding protein Ku